MLLKRDSGGGIVCIYLVGRCIVYILYMLIQYVLSADTVSRLFRVNDFWIADHQHSACICDINVAAASSSTQPYICVMTFLAHSELHVVVDVLGRLMTDPAVLTSLDCDSAT